MAIGRTFKEALGKGIRSLEIGHPRACILTVGGQNTQPGCLKITYPRDRLFQVLAALHNGMSEADIIEATGYDPWFVDQLLQIVEIERAVAGSYSWTTLPPNLSPPGQTPWPV